MNESEASRNARSVLPSSVHLVCDYITLKLEQITEKYGTDLYIMLASIHELVITPVNC